MLSTKNLQIGFNVRVSSTTRQPAIGSRPHGMDARNPLECWNRSPTTARTHSHHQQTANRKKKNKKTTTKTKTNDQLSDTSRARLQPAKFQWRQQTCVARASSPLRTLNFHWISTITKTQKHNAQKICLSPSLAAVNGARCDCSLCVLGPQPISPPVDGQSASEFIWAHSPSVPQWIYGGPVAK